MTINSLSSFFIKFFIITIFLFGCNDKQKSNLPDPDWFDIDYSGKNHISQKMDI